MPRPLSSKQMVRAPVGFVSVKRLTRQEKQSRTDAHKSSRTAELASTLSAIRSMVVNLVGMALALLLCLLAWLQIRDTIGADLVEVSPFEVSEDLGKRYASGETIAAGIGTYLRAMSHRVSDDPRNPGKYATSASFALAGSGPQLDIQVPGAGLSFKDFTRMLQRALANRHFQVSGRIIQRGERLTMTVRVMRSGAPPIDTIAQLVDSDLEDVETKAAEFVAYQVNPYALVKFKFSTEERRCASAPPCDFSAGMKWVERVLREGDVKHVSEAYVAWSYALGIAGDMEGSASKSRFAAQIDPTNEIASWNLGVALNYLGKFSEAAEKFEAALRINPNNADALFGLGDALWGMGRHEESLQKVAEGAKHSPVTDWPLKSWGTRLLDQDKAAEAQEKLKLAIELNPVDASTWKLLALAQAMLGADSSALLETWRNVVEISPSDPLGYERVGNALYDLRRYGEAVSYFERSIELGKPIGRRDATLHLGYALFALEQYERAIKAFRASLAIKPTADAYAMVGDALNRLGRHAEALPEYAMASKLKPDQASIFINWSNALLKLKRFSEAVDKSNHAVTLAANQPDALKIAYLNRAQANLALGHLPEATADYRKVLDIDPKYRDSYIGMASVLEKEGKSAEAAEMRSKAASLPDS